MLEIFDPPLIAHDNASRLQIRALYVPAVGMTKLPLAASPAVPNTAIRLP
jgi:hypothetical protein